MDFRLSNEQTLLRESLGGWLARNYTFDHWRELTAARPPSSLENWSSFAEMGWLGVSIPEKYDGLGAGAVEQMIVAEAFGAHLVVEPYFSTIALAANVIMAAGDEALTRAWLPRIAQGRAKLSFAFAERRSRFSLNFVATRARETSAGYRLSGEKILVLDASGADRWLVLARTGGDVGARDGLSLFIVDPKEAGIAMRDYATLDDRRAADITFDETPAEAILGVEGTSFAAVEAATDRALVALCAEGIGAMRALLDATLAYVKLRKQFGQAIGDFQVIQHRIVEMRVQLECSRALCLRAAFDAAENSSALARAVSAAKVQVGRSARVVGRAAIQLHGGIGMTNDLAVGHYFKRLLFVETMLGDIDFHQKRFISLAAAAA